MSMHFALSVGHWVLCFEAPHCEIISGLTSAFFSSINLAVNDLNWSLRIEP